MRQLRSTNGLDLPVASSAGRRGSRPGWVIANASSHSSPISTTIRYLLGMSGRYALTVAYLA
jgi:hypothetical protein